GSAFYGMIGITSGAMLNVALDPLFIFGFDMGVAGAALATSEPPNKKVTARTKARSRWSIFFFMFFLLYRNSRFFVICAATVMGLPHRATHTCTCTHKNGKTAKRRFTSAIQMQASKAV
ncbi:MAG: hypothetical protein IJB94_03040, partial [Clostridia bacterium]|nr:hypothetical protein [Clostridia bacterium]